MTASLSGGSNLAAKLRAIAAAVEQDRGVKVGFLDGATYPEGTPVAKVAGVQEFGGTINMPAREQTITRTIDKDGGFKQGGRFTKRAKSNFETTHAVAAHVIHVPARPFFRPMIAANAPTWGEKLGKAIAANDYDVARAFAIMGEIMKGQLQASIKAVTSPPLARSTVAKKGFEKPLVDSSVMLNSADYEVTE